MHLLLMIPSSLLLLLLLLHSWHYRGRRATLIFFLACFAFGVLRGNTIYQIITNLLGGTTLPYLMVRPVIKVWQASLQECIGWIFALYLSWSTVEWLLTSGRDGEKVPLFRLAGLSALMMGAVAYAVEAAAAAVKWWVWTIPVRNPFYSDVPFAGVIAWISTGVDFLGVFLILYYGGFKSRWRWLLPLLFPLHMLLHTKVSNINATWLPFNPAELWHWLMLCALFLGVAVGGPAVSTRLEQSERGKALPGVRQAVFIALGGFLLTLLAAHLGKVRDPYLLISLVPFITIVLFIRPLWAVAFCAVSCLAYGLIVGAWSMLLVPLLVLGVYGSGLPPFGSRLSARRRLQVAVAALLLASVGVFWGYAARAGRYTDFSRIGEALQNETTESGVERLVSEMPDPPKPEDSFHLNLLGASLNKHQNYTAARSVLERGLVADSTYPYLWINLGWTCMHLNLYDRAVEAYERAIQLDPVDMESYVFLGQLYEGRERAKEAEELYRRGLSYRPADLRVILALESLLYRQGRLDEATSLLKGSLHAGGEDMGKLYARLAGDLLKKGSGDEAVTYYKETIREGVHQISTAALSLAYIYWKDRNDPENALRYVRLAVAVNPVTEAFTMKAAILESMGRADEAQEAYHQAAQAQAQAEASPKGN